MKSNQWYGSLYEGFPSQPLYALPLAFKLNDEGLGFSYPDIVKTPNAIHASYDMDFTVGIENSFITNEIRKINDWSIETRLKTRGNQTLDFTIGHGIPFTTIYGSENLIISIPNGFNLYPQNQKDPIAGTLITNNSFRLTTRNHNYIVVFPKGTNSEVNNKIIRSNSKKVFVGLLDKTENYENFQDISDTQILNTNSSFDLQNNNLYTTYSIKTNHNKPLIAIYY